MRTPPVFAAALILATLLPLHAQERRSGPATNSYLVEYNFRDGPDTATATERRFSLMVNGEHKGSFKVGSRIPAVSGTFEPVTANSLVNTQYTYLDVGVSVECTLLELDTRVELHTAIDLSALADKEAAPAAGNGRNPSPNPSTNPAIKDTKLDLNTTLRIGKPTVVASIADPVTNRTLQLTVTVTAVN